MGTNHDQRGVLFSESPFRFFAFAPTAQAALATMEVLTVQPPQPPEGESPHPPLPLTNPNPNPNLQPEPAPQEKWIAALRLERLDQIRAEAGRLRRHHGELSTARDGTLSRLERELDLAEDGYRSEYARHAGRIDGLAALYQDTVLAMERDFSRRVAELAGAHAAEGADMEGRHGSAVLEARDRIDALRVREARREARDGLVRREEAGEGLARAAEEAGTVRSALEARALDLEDLLGRAREDHARGCEDREAEYRALRAEGGRMRLEGESLASRIDRLRRGGRRFEGAGLRNAARVEEERRSLSEGRAAALERYRSAQGSLDRGREGRRDRIVSLAGRAREIGEAMRKKHALALRILKLAEAAARLEEERGGGTGPPPRPLPGAAAGPVDLVEAANERCASTMLDLREQDGMLRDLRRENAALKARLGCLRDGTALGDGAVLGGNPLLVVNGRLVG